jgi:hypothetical protein
MFATLYAMLRSVCNEAFVAEDMERFQSEYQEACGKEPSTLCFHVKGARVSAVNPHFAVDCEGVADRTAAPIEEGDVLVSVDGRRVDEKNASLLMGGGASGAETIVKIKKSVAKGGGTVQIKLMRWPCKLVSLSESLTSILHTDEGGEAGDDHREARLVAEQLIRVVRDEWLASRQHVGSLESTLKECALTADKALKAAADAIKR